MTLNTKKVIFIVGPTGVGKTKASIKLAKYFNCEIISCDSRQFYKELKIGAAPPNKKELSDVKHHFIHNLSVDKEYNAGNTVIIPLKAKHRVENKSNCLLVFIEVQTGEYFGEDDIIRINDDYGRK